VGGRRGEWRRERAAEAEATTKRTEATAAAAEAAAAAAEARRCGCCLGVACGGSLVWAACDRAHKLRLQSCEAARCEQGLAAC